MGLNLIFLSNLSRIQYPKTTLNLIILFDVNNLECKNKIIKLVFRYLFISTKIAKKNKVCLS